MAKTYKTSSATDTGSLNYHINNYALAQGFRQLDDDLVVTKLVTNLSEQARGQGSRYAETVRVPFTGSVSATDKTPGTDFTPSAATSTKQDININTHKVWSILVEDYGSLFAQRGLLTQYLMDGAHAIADEVESDIISLYASFSYDEGTAGGGIDRAGLANLRSVARSSTNKFSQSRAMNLVVDPEGIEDMLTVNNFVQVDQSGSDEALRSARMGRIFGMDIYESNVISAVSGTPAGRHGMLFQKDAMGIAFVDMSLSDVPDSATAGADIETRTLSDDNGNATYSMRMIKSYDHEALGGILSVDTIYGYGMLRSEHAIEYLY
jgi:hypothetical protein